MDPNCPAGHCGTGGGICVRENQCVCPGLWSKVSSIKYYEFLWFLTKKSQNNIVTMVSLIFFSRMLKPVLAIVFVWMV